MPPVEGRGLRVYHLPALVGDHGPSLARLERSVGVESVSVAEMPHAFGFDANQTLWRPGDSPFLLEWRRWCLFLRLLREADVVHYNWGRTLFPDLRPRPSPAERGWPRPLSWLYRLYGRCMAELELRLLRIRGVRMVVTFQGDDARQADACRARGSFRTADAMPNDEWTAREDAWRRRMIARFDRFAHAIFALNPDLCWILPSRAIFLPYLHWDPRTVPVNAPKNHPEMIVAHAPSVRARKGTDAVIAAIEALRAEGIPIRLQLIEGMSHQACIQAMSEADIFVDQLLYGWYGGAAVEAMSLGLPTIVYIESGDLRWLPQGMEEQLPVLRATTETVRAKLLELVQMGSEGRRLVGQASRAFVERWHDPRQVAQVVMNAYRFAGRE
jgi:glycosyltransferase involved in cell wall biosynthesis